MYKFSRGRKLAKKSEVFLPSCIKHLLFSHLTYNRHKEFKLKDNTNWHTAKMVVAMLCELDTFFAKLPVHMKPWFQYRDTSEQYRGSLEQWAKNPLVHAHTMDGEV